jgi:hypothetical protein
MGDHALALLLVILLTINLGLTVWNIFFKRSA